MSYLWKKEIITYFGVGWVMGRAADQKQRIIFEWPKKIIPGDRLNPTILVQLYGVYACSFNVCISTYV